MPPYPPQYKFLESDTIEFQIPGYKSSDVSDTRVPNSRSEKFQGPGQQSSEFRDGKLQGPGQSSSRLPEENVPRYGAKELQTPGSEVPGTGTKEHQTSGNRSTTVQDRGVPCSV